MTIFLKISILICAVVACVSANAQTTINADNSNLQYQGRINFVDVAAPIFVWPATSVKMKFTGTSVTLLMTDALADGGRYTTNYYDIILDNKIIKALAMNNTITLYSLANNLVDKEHVIEIFKRTEVGPSTFNGFIITGTILPLDPLATRKIEIVGASYETGYGNEKSYINPNANPGYQSVNQDADSAYSAILCRRFDAQSMCTSIAGTGMYRNYISATGTAPDLYNELYPFNVSSNWDHSNYIPDLMIISLGANDFGAETKNGIVLDSASFVNTYISFINTVKGFNPDIKILMIYGGLYPGNNYLIRFRNYMLAINNHFASAGNVYKFELSPKFSPYGEEWHPTKANHVAFADQLTPVIQNIMQWSVGSTTYDCNGVLGGSATIDGCGICTGGNTNFTSCLTAGILNSNTKPEINIYPNPTADFVYFDVEQKWELFDGIGKTIRTGEGKEISLKNLSNGMYLIKLENSSSLIRVIKV